MWTVIRKRQGESNVADPIATVPADIRYERNQRTILLHEVRRDIPEMDPKIFTKPYGDLIFEKIRRWLLDEDPSLRLQATEQLLELYIESRDHCIRSLSYDILPVLITTMCHDSVPEIREHAAAALELLTKEYKAKSMLLKLHESEKILEKLLGALGDPTDGVIVLALRVLQACHSNLGAFNITEKFVELGSIPIMIDLVRRENVVVRAVACAALVPIFDIKEAFIIFMKSEGMEVVTSALKSDDAMLLAEASEVISRAGEYKMGKRAAVKCQTLSLLAPHIQHENLTVRVSVTAAIAQLTIFEPGKFQAVDLHIPEAVVELMTTEDERDVLVNVGKIILNVAEHPEGQKILKACKPRLIELSGLVGEDISLSFTLEKAIYRLDQIHV